MIKGSCACGRVQYQAEGKPSAVNACHCGTCQKVSGGPFLGFVDFDTSDIKWSQEPDIWSASDFAQRGFCQTCGSAVSMKYLFQKNSIGLTLGTITEANPPIPGLTHHFYVSEKAPWFVLPDDGAERFDGLDAAFQANIDKWRAEKEGK